MVGLDPIALTGRFFSVLAAPRRALLRSGGGISLEPRSGDIVEPGARAPGLRLAPWQPSPGGATPGAGMEHRGGWSARRCRPRWGPGKWMIRVVLGLMPQALRSRPASGAQKRLTSNVGRTPLACLSVTKMAVENGGRRRGKRPLTTDKSKLTTSSS